MALSLEERENIETYGRRADGNVKKTLSYLQEAKQRGEIDYVPVSATICRVLSSLGIYKPSHRGRPKKDPAIIELERQKRQEDSYGERRVLSAGQVRRRVGKRLTPEERKKYELFGAPV